MTKQDVRNAWLQLCRGRRRSIPMPTTGHLPILYETNREVRDAGIKWYCGSFPGNPDRLQMILGMEQYNRHKTIIQTGMQAEAWSESLKKKTTESIRAFLTVLEDSNGFRRKRKRVGTADESRKQKRVRRSFQI